MQGLMQTWCAAAGAAAHRTCSFQDGFSETSRRLQLSNGFSRLPELWWHPALLASSQEAQDQSQYRQGPHRCDDATTLSQAGSKLLV